MPVIVARLLILAAGALGAWYGLAAPPGSGFAVLRVVMAAFLWSGVGWRLAESALGTPALVLGLALESLALVGLLGAMALL